MEHEDDNRSLLRFFYLRAKQVVGSFVIARHPDGTIRRRFADGTIILKNKWEEVTDEEDLWRYHKCFVMTATERRRKLEAWTTKQEAEKERQRLHETSKSRWKTLGIGIVSE